jgi:hypothetical protein
MSLAYLIIVKFLLTGFYFVASKYHKNFTQT